MCQWEDKAAGRFVHTSISVFAFTLQHCWRSEGETGAARKSLHLCGSCVCLHFTLSSLQVFSAPSLDMGTRGTVCISTSSISFIHKVLIAWMMFSIDFVLFLLRWSLLPVPEENWGQPDLPRAVWKSLILWKAHHWQHALCWEPGLDHWFLQCELWANLCNNWSCVVILYALEPFTKPMLLVNGATSACAWCTSVWYFLTTWRYNNVTFKSLISICCVSVTVWYVFTGWLRWSAGVWSLRPDVSVWDCELGWWVCQEKQTRGLHTSHQLQHVDCNRNRPLHVHKRTNVSYKVMLCVTL